MPKRQVKYGYVKKSDGKRDRRFKHKVVLTKSGLKDQRYADVNITRRKTNVTKGRTESPKKVERVERRGISTQKQTRKTNVSPKQEIDRLRRELAALKKDNAKIRKEAINKVSGEIQTKGRRSDLQVGATNENAQLNELHPGRIDTEGRNIETDTKQPKRKSRRKPKPEPKITKKIQTDKEGKRIKDRTGGYTTSIEINLDPGTINDKANQIEDSKFDFLKYNLEKDKPDPKHGYRPPRSVVVRFLFNKGDKAKWISTNMFPTDKAVTKENVKEFILNEIQAYKDSWHERSKTEKIEEGTGEEGEEETDYELFPIDNLSTISVLFIYQNPIEKYRGRD